MSIAENIYDSEWLSSGINSGGLKYTKCWVETAVWNICIPRVKGFVV